MVNLGLINAGHKVLPIDGVSPDDMEALAEAMPHLDFEYFVFPFLAHALGTLVGAIVAGLVAASHKMIFVWVIGALFFIGGIMVNYMVQGPLWFTIADIALAYIPMAWIAGKIALKLSGNTSTKSQ